MTKYQVVEVPADNEANAAWQVINARKNTIVSTHETQGEAFKAVQMIIEDEKHPNY